MAGEGNPPVPAAQANVDSPTPTDAEASAAGLGTPTREELLAAFDSGYAGEAFTGITPPITGYEKTVAAAWAKGVWQRQGEAETRRRKRVIAEMEARLKVKIPEQTPEARLARALDYQRRFG